MCSFSCSGLMTSYWKPALFLQRSRKGGSLELTNKQPKDESIEVDITSGQGQKPIPSSKNLGNRISHPKKLGLNNCSRVVQTMWFCGPRYNAWSECHTVPQCTWSCSASTMWRDGRSQQNWFNRSGLKNSFHTMNMMYLQCTCFYLPSIWDRRLTWTKTSTPNDP